MEVYLQVLSPPPPGSLKLLESIQQFYEIIIKNDEIINVSKQHHYMKVHLHIDSAGKLPNRVIIDPVSKLGHFGYLRDTSVGSMEDISARSNMNMTNMSRMNSLEPFPHRAHLSQPCKMVDHLQEAQLLATAYPTWLLLAEIYLNPKDIILRLARARTLPSLLWVCISRCMYPVQPPLLYHRCSHIVQWPNYRFKFLFSCKDMSFSYKQSILSTLTPANNVHSSHPLLFRMVCIALFTLYKGDLFHWKPSLRRLFPPQAGTHATQIPWDPTNQPYFIPSITTCLLCGQNQNPRQLLLPLWIQQDIRFKQGRVNDTPPPPLASTQKPKCPRGLVVYFFFFWVYSKQI